jgi:DNA-binding response OmpR family regulator
MATKAAKKILVAEDDPDIRRIITLTLAKTGMVVLAAQDGEEAFEKAVSLQPDAIVLDIGLPKMDGLALCEKLRRTDNTAQIPVGFLTAEVGTESYKKAKNAGGLLYMPKPFKPEKLVSFVQILLASQRPAEEL